ncbi:hypothetical protein [Cohnella rhizosphaerae]|uniref:Uncharacterized protein n=1 Tax=Cohnella rhizosphaerae TaxID=1457232 RepID=A0A9X4KSA4_9BACL|nr:hypothetical protein [Cohnella rhizosphaerae]MDG0810000.1 hypothetical protein [Cohnella rhizosphaerae]
MHGRSGHSAGLLSRLRLPIFALIVVIIAFFATAASYILIRVQNDHTRDTAEQSMKFVYRNIWYQFDTMNNVAAFILSNPSIEGLLESEYPAAYEAADDFFALQTNLQNLSLLSLLNGQGGGRVPTRSYVVSIALEPSSGLYAMAPDRYDPSTGIYKSIDLRSQDWYRNLSEGRRQAEWWGQRAGAFNPAMIYAARKKDEHQGRPAHRHRRRRGGHGQYSKHLREREAGEGLPSAAGRERQGHLQRALSVSDAGRRTALRERGFGRFGIAGPQNRRRAAPGHVRDVRQRLEAAHGRAGEPLQPVYVRNLGHRRGDCGRCAADRGLYFKPDRRPGDRADHAARRGDATPRSAGVQGAAAGAKLGYLRGG